MRIIALVMFCLLVCLMHGAYADFDVCLDTGAPISGSTINIDADALAATGTKYVRLNFILGSWSSPTDATLHNGMTWMQCYDSIVNSLTKRGLKVYGLIGGEAVKNGGALNTDLYVDAYTKNFVTIVEHFKDRVRVFESFNEPNDWAGGTTAQVEPYWFAKMLQKIYMAVKIDNGHIKDPTWQVTLVSGPLFGHDIASSYEDTGASYMDAVYKAGIDQLSWKSIRADHGTYPLDGIGYHTYVTQGPNKPKAIKDRLNYNINSIWDIISKYEGTGSKKKIWISECGWNTAHISASEQARNVTTAFTAFRDHPRVAMGTCFQICDFGGDGGWGIFKGTPYTEANKKPSWTAFRDFAVGNADLNRKLPRTSNPASPPGKAVPPTIGKGLIAHWAFDEGAGTVARDTSGNGADCDLINTSWATDQQRKTADFNGINSYIEARDPHKGDISGAFTISFWMKPQSWADQYSGGIISKRRNDAAPGYVIYADGNFPKKINLRISGTSPGAAMLKSESNVDEGLWQQWVVTYDPQSRVVTWYKNGKFDKKYGAIDIGDTTNDTPIQIGHAHTWNGFYDGRLDDLKIYDRTLSAEEIKAEFKSGGTIQHTFVPIKWRVISTRYPTSDVIVAGCTVRDAGAKGDSKTDDTAAFQSAMDTMSRAGGGTVFVPEGRYVIKGNLKVPTGVTLRGEWQKPTGKPTKGSILMAYAGRGDTEGRPFIALRQCTGIIGLTIWYPEQDAANIVPYPFCIQQMGSASATVSNVTLVNAYQGIRTNYGSYLHYFHSVYGSPLSVGIEIGFVSDTGRVDKVYFNPGFWSDSGLPGAPKKNGAHAIWMHKNGTGMLFRRYEWIYSAFVNLSGYNTGIKMFNSQTMGETNGQMYKYSITDCNTAIDIVNANFAGISFTKCLLDGSDYGILTRDTFNSRLLFHSCDIRGGKKAALLDGIDNQSMMFQNCSFTGEVDRPHGDLVMLGCSVTSAGDHLRLGRAVNAVTIAGTTYNGEARIINENVSGRVKITSDPIPPTKMPDFPQLKEKMLKPAKSTLFLISKGNSKIKDYTGIIQKALDAASKNGGGIVFITGGIYPVRGNLLVPSGVELRGVYDVEHHSRGLGSMIQVYAGRNNENAVPFIIMKKNSGLRGLSFYYPEQLCDEIVPYPFLVQGRGEDIYVVNINAMNPYKLLDFRTYRCDRHHIEYPAGAPLRVGVAVGGGSVGGTVLNAMFNSNNWAWSLFADSPGLGTKGAKKGVNLGWIFQYQNLEAFVFGNCKDELQYQNSVFGSKIGLHFVAENGIGASGIVLGHGTDGSLIPIAFDGLGPNGMDVINSQFVSMYCVGLEPIPEKRYIHCGPKLNSTARLYNTTLWGTPNHAATVMGGTLDMELASFWINNPFLVDKGELRLTNTFLNPITEGDAEFVVRNGGRVSLSGTLSAGPICVDKDAASAEITSALENERGR